MATIRPLAFLCMMAMTGRAGIEQTARLLETVGEIAKTVHPAHAPSAAEAGAEREAQRAERDAQQARNGAADHDCRSVDVMLVLIAKRDRDYRDALAASAAVGDCQ